MRCPSCDHDNRAERRFCAECGAALTGVCSTCGRSNEPGEKFCGGCGVRLEGPGGGDQGLVRDPFPSFRTPVPDPHASGERRQLTVLFCDLVGSTPLSQELDAEEWREVISRYQRAATAAVEKLGGHVAKNLGDGLLVYFGWPSAREDDAERAIRAGLAVVEAVKGLAVTGPGDQSLTLTANPLTPNPLSVRVGMHTGPVVIAEDGEVFGETANLAARVQSAAGPDTVLITATTLRLAAGLFVVEDRGPEMLKGVREPVQLYRVVQPSGVRSRLDVAAGRLTHFVGREMELGTLLDRWERVGEAQGQNVLVMGEAGVGKSRLGFELRQRLAAAPHTWLECRATPYTQGTPFFPIIELVAQGLALGPDDTLADKITKLERGLSVLNEPLADTLPIVATLLGLPLPERYPRAASGPDMERQRTLEILSAWNLALGEAQPLVLFVEDLHWCDPSSLQLLGRVIEQSPTARVLFIATARPDFVPPWSARSNTTTLQLARLTKRQAREMVHALGGPLPAATVETLVARADGVPLYIEELTKTVTEPGAARGAQAIPATLADSLMARLDRLSTAKEVAQRAAVLGREFPYALLAAIVDLDEAALQQGLARLVGAEILFVRGAAPAATYTFKHALVQEAAYESMLKRVRQQLHGRVYEALRGREGGDGGDAGPEVLAHHAERAGLGEQAIRELERAATAACGRSAHSEAVRHLERALALLTAQPESADRDAREAELQLALGESSSVSAGYAHAATRAAFERSATLAQRVRATRTWMIARVGVAVGEDTSGRHARARALAEEVLAAAGGADDAEGSVTGCVIITNMDHWLGRFESSVAHAKRVLAAYERAPAGESVHDIAYTDNRSAVSGWAAWSLCLLGRLDEALAQSAEAVLHAEHSRHTHSLPYALFFDAVVRYLCGDSPAQQARAKEAMALGDRFGFPLWSGLGRLLHGVARVRRGDASGLAEMLEGIAGAGQTGSQNGAPMMLEMLADAQRRVGQPRDAETTLASALALAAALGERNWEAELHVTDGEIARATGAPLDDVLARLRTAQAVAQELGALLSELRAATAMAGTLRDAGHPADARAALSPVYAKFTQGFATPRLVESKALLETLSR